jgi:hypothetical protein
MADGEDTFQSNPTSWYYRLSKCMIQVLLPVIDLLAEDHGRKKKTILDSSFIDNYLLNAWTGSMATSETTSGHSSSDGMTVPEQLLIPEWSLAKWDEHLKYERVYKMMGLDNETDSESGFQETEIQDWRSEVPENQAEIAEKNALSIEHDLSEAVLETLPQVNHCHRYLI